MHPRKKDVEERIADALEALLVRLAQDAKHSAELRVILERIAKELEVPDGGDDQQAAIDAATAKLKANNDRTEAVLKPST